jgi:hypothetical protein
MDNTRKNKEAKSASVEEEIMVRRRGPNKSAQPDNWLSPIGIQAIIYHFFWMKEDYSIQKEKDFLLYLIKKNVRPYLVVFPDGSKHYYVNITTDPRKFFALKSEMGRKRPTFEGVQSMTAIPRTAKPMMPEIPLPSEVSP